LLELFICHSNRSKINHICTERKLTRAPGTSTIFYLWRRCPFYQQPDFSGKLSAIK